MSLQDSLEQYRGDFPSLSRYRNNKPPIYMDSACTTLVPQVVIDAIDEYYSNYPACGGRRSHHWFAEEVTSRIEGDPDNEIQGTRQSIADLINAESRSEIIFTLNTTQSINMVASGIKFKPGDVVLLSDREHNSNLLPWLRLQKSGFIKVENFIIEDEKEFNIDAFEEKFKTKKIRLLSLAWTSNVTGVTLPAKEIIKIAHRYGTRVLLDGAQTVPHQPVDVRDLDVDFLAFSLHKMCGPRGVGILYAKKELLGRGAYESQSECDAIEPVFLGGGTVDDSTYDSFNLLDGPERFEAGIQNYSGLIASKKAVDYLKQVGLTNISAHEEQLNKYLTKKLLENFGNQGWFTIIGPQDAKKRGGILTFEVRRPNAVGIADELDNKNNIMIRDGVFCVHSYFNQRFGPHWLHPKTYKDHRMIYRISLYLYNTLTECDILVETLNEIFTERCYL